MEEGEREGPLGIEGETEAGKPCGGGPWGPGRCGSCDHSTSQVAERGRGKGPRRRTARERGRTAVWGSKWITREITENPRV